MLLLNFGHPLTAEQRAQIEELTGRQIDHTIEANLQVDQALPLRPQIVIATDQIALTTSDWQTQALLVNLPGYAPVAACLLAEIEGRSGHLPSIIKMRPVADSLLTEYEVVEIINLQDLRAEARTRR